MSTDVMTVSPVQEMDVKGLSIVEQALSLKITDQAALESAATLLQVVIIPLRGEISDYHAPMKQAAHRSHQVICEQERKLLEPVATAERVCKQKIADYHREQARLRQEEQRRLESEASRKAEEEQESRITQAEADGATDEEVTVMLKAPPVAAPVVAPQRVASVSGVSLRENWKVQITDPMALIRFVAQNPQWQNLLEPNMTAINQMARAQKQLFSLPGMRVFNDTIVNARAR